jgi:hypothetical protein
VLARLFLAELPPVNPGPLLVYAPKLALAKLQLLPRNVSGRDLHVHVRVVGVPVDGGDHPRLREALGQMPVDHLFGFFVVHLPVKRVDSPVMRPRLPLTSMGLCQLVFFELPGELAQVCHPFFVADFFRTGPIDVLRHVLRPDPLTLPFGRPLAADVSRVIGCRA